MEKVIIELEKVIVGNGEVKGYTYTQIERSDSAYLYEVSKYGVFMCFEVFKRKNSPVCIDFEKRLYSETEFKESYPKSNSFGVWAWTKSTKQSALDLFNTL